MTITDRHEVETIPFIESTEGEASIIAELMIKLNCFVSIEVAETITTLDKTTQYRERRKGKFPTPVEITSSGRRKAYRINDLIDWLEK